MHARRINIADLFFVFCVAYCVSLAAMFVFGLFFS